MRQYGQLGSPAPGLDWTRRCVTSDEPGTDPVPGCFRVRVVVRTDAVGAHPGGVQLGLLVSHTGVNPLARRETAGKTA